jgi:hypothetical protein
LIDQSVVAFVAGEHVHACQLARLLKVARDEALLKATELTEDVSERNEDAITDRSATVRIV